MKVPIAFQSGFSLVIIQTPTPKLDKPSVL